MNERPDVLLGPGFLGGWRRPVGLVRSWRADAGEDVFAALAAMARDVPPGGVLTGYVGYEAAGPLHGLALPAPPAFGGCALPMAWAGHYEGTEAAGPPVAGAVPEAAVLPSEDASAYEAKVASIVSAILAGDLFQANLSRRLSAAFAARPDPDTLPGALFARLTAGTDAPYAAMIALGEGAVLSASPELFLDVRGDRVAAEPIKGTRPRGATPEADAALAADLAASEKDRAENVMIADLMRNDLSRVCEDGSMVEVAVCALRTLPRVHHLYSRIEARLRPDVSAFGALAAAFPCGSITGAPKLAAMRLIAALEGEGRGPYCGTVFAATRERAVFSVPIRTGVLTYGDGGGARLDVRTGGGVTALSDPGEEHAETRDKAYPFGLMTGRA